MSDLSKAAKGFSFTTFLADLKTGLGALESVAPFIEMFLPAAGTAVIGAIEAGGTLIENDAPVIAAAVKGPTVASVTDAATTVINDVDGIVQSKSSGGLLP